MQTLGQIIICNLCTVWVYYLIFDSGSEERGELSNDFSYY